MTTLEPLSATAPGPTAELLSSAFPPLPITDEGLIRLGGQTPLFGKHAVADDGTVRLGGQAPMFYPESIADAGLVRMGGQSPIF